MSDKASEPDTRTIQEVLRLHIDSVEGMIEMHERHGDTMDARYYVGKREGLLRAIEVADYRANAAIALRKEADERNRTFFGIPLRKVEAE